MKNISKYKFARILVCSSLLAAFGCQRDLSELQSAEYSKNPEVLEFSFGLAKSISV